MKRSSSGLWIALVAAILLLAAALRLYRIDAQSLWYDEGNSAFAATQPLSRIVEGASHDIHPPGYYILLAGWHDLTGSSELALRSLSALMGVLTVALIYGIGTRLFDRPSGALAALLVAANPFQVWYGQEARMYAQLGLFSAASVWLTILVLRIPGEMAAGRFRPRRAAAIIGGLVLVNAAGLYTHYTFPFTLLAESLAFVVWLLGRPRRLHGLITWAAIQVVALLLFLPWLPTAIHQLTTWPKVPAPLVSLTDIGVTLAYGITISTDTAQAGLIALLLLAMVGLFPPVEADRRYLRFPERIGLAALWLLVPVAIPVALGIVREPFLKFFVPSSLALMLLVARGITMGFRLAEPTLGVSRSTSPWLMRAVVLIPIVVGALPVPLSLQNLYFNPAYARDDYRAIAQRIYLRPGRTPPSCSTHLTSARCSATYFPDGANITPLPDAHTAQTLDDLLAHHTRIYALYYGAAEQDPQGTVEKTLSERAFVAWSQWYGHVRLVLYVVPAQAAAAPEVTSDARFGELITLEGYTLSAQALRPGDALAVTLFWRTAAPLDQRYKVFVHVYGPDGALVAQHDGEPGGGLIPTDTWTPGDTIADNHGVLLPVDAAPGIYQVMVGLYGDDGQRLPVSGEGAASDNRLLLGEIRVGP